MLLNISLSFLKTIITKVYLSLEMQGAIYYRVKHAIDTGEIPLGDYNNQPKRITSGRDLIVLSDERYLYPYTGVTYPYDSYEMQRNVRSKKHSTSKREKSDNKKSSKSKRAEKYKLKKDSGSKQKPSSSSKCGWLRKLLCMSSK